MTLFIANLHQVESPFWMGILMTLIYIFLVHFVQEDDCLLNGFRKIFKMTAPPKIQLSSIEKESFQKIATELLEDSPNNEMYYRLTQRYYPMNNKYQMNTKDCTNDGSCLIPEDKNNLHPVKQKLSEVLPIPNIQNSIFLNQLNPSLSANQQYPVPVISQHSITMTNVDDINNDISNNANNSLVNTSGNGLESGLDLESGNKTTENFGLFETYHMDDLKKPIYYNAPVNGHPNCKSCSVGYCRGDLCTVSPFDRFRRNDPLNQ